MVARGGSGEGLVGVCEMDEGDQKKKKKVTGKNLMIISQLPKKMWKNIKSILNFKNLVKLGRYTSLTSFLGLRCYQKNKFWCSLLKSQYLRDSVGWKEKVAFFRKQTNIQRPPPKFLTKQKNFKGEESEIASQIMLFCIRLLVPATGCSYLKDILFFWKKKNSYILLQPWNCLLLLGKPHQQLMITLLRTAKEQEERLM